MRQGGDPFVDQTCRSMTPDDVGTLERAIDGAPTSNRAIAAADHTPKSLSARERRQGHSSRR
jgi:hypothetical protein